MLTFFKHDELPKIDKNPNITEPYINRQCGRVGPGRRDSCDYYKSQSKNITCLTCEEELCNGSGDYPESGQLTFAVVLAMSAKIAQIAGIF